LDETLRKKLAESDPGFRELQQQHVDFDRKLAALMEKPYRSADDDVEEALLKKKKLWLKDQMEARSAQFLMVRDGIYYGIAGLALAVLLLFLTHSYILVAVPLLLAAFFLWFFRDPARTVPQGGRLVIAPADGKLTAVENIVTPAGGRIRLSIFLNVFDVHVNRSPVEGLIRSAIYKKGKYLNAMDPQSSVLNEQNVVEMETPEGDLVGYSQIAGLLARRVVFNKKAGDLVERGEKIGMMKFGSRMDVLLPAGSLLLVKLGQRVKGGETVLAELPAVSASAGDGAEAVLLAGAV
jgi:phosphatidylserine decarboxylase